MATEPDLEQLKIRHLCDADAHVLDALLAARSGEAAGALDASAAERAQRLTHLLTLLDAQPVEACPPDLVTRTMTAVVSAHQQDRFASQVQMLAEQPPAMGVGWRQVASAAAVFLLGVSLLFPFLERNRAEALRLSCATNLQTAGMAFGRYAADHGQALPRGYVQPGAVWWNVGQGDTGQNQVVQSNSAHLYLLVRGGYVTSADALACPGNLDAPWGEMTADHHDWPSAQAVSYSYQNQYTPRPLRLDVADRMAVLADKNPLFIARQQGGMAFNSAAAATTPSRIHGSRGQNILATDGSVTWTIRPTLGRSRPGESDNIWLLAGVQSYTGTEHPDGLGDSFLVP